MTDTDEGIVDYTDDCGRQWTRATRARKIADESDRLASGLLRFAVEAGTANGEDLLDCAMRVLRERNSLSVSEHTEKMKRMEAELERDALRARVAELEAAKPVAISIPNDVLEAARAVRHDGDIPDTHEKVLADWVLTITKSESAKPRSDRRALEVLREWANEQRRVSYDTGYINALHQTIRKIDELLAAETPQPDGGAR